MRRRNFISLVGGAAVWPLAGRAQQQSRLPIIGYLGASTAAATNRWTAAFVQRLREFGWIEGRTVAIRAAGGHATVPPSMPESSFPIRARTWRSLIGWRRR
jgi:putative tryptophan/tyrosine transport system substrate-binding protein